MKAKTWFRALGQRTRNTHPGADLSTAFKLGTGIAPANMPGWALTSFKLGFFNW